MTFGEFCIDIEITGSPAGPSEPTLCIVRAVCPPEIRERPVTVKVSLPPSVFRDIGPVGQAVLDRTGAGETSGVAEVEAYGKMLYHALFLDSTLEDNDNVEGQLHFLLGTVANRFENQVRLRIRTADPRLLRIPWELLHDGGSWLVRRPRWSLVRHVVRDAPAVETIAVEGRLSVLGMVANHEGEGFDQLETMGERRRMDDALRDLEVLSWTADGTADHLREEIRNRKPHVFHFIGHGGYQASTDKGVLVFEGSAGSGSSRQPALRDADWLFDTLDHRNLKLVVLNACETAAAGHLDGGERPAPLASMAAQLVQRFDAVIAMQWKITDSLAQAFSAEFYKVLATTGTVDEAMEEGRLAIFSADPTSLEWAVPQFYMRSTEGQLFVVPKDDRSAAPASGDQEPTDDAPPDVATENTPADHRQANGPMELRPGPDLLDPGPAALQRDLWSEPNLVTSARRDDAQPSFVPTTANAQTFGDSLHRALLADPAAAEALSRLNPNPQTGPAIRLVINTTDAPELAELPWEFLRDGTNFVSTNPLTPVVRSLERGIPPAIIEVDEPLQVLLATAQPEDEPLSADEVKLLTDVLESTPGSSRVEITRVPQLTRRRLEEKLPGKHVFHFIGHGRTVGQEGAIILAAESGDGPDLFTAGDFADWIRGYLTDLRLVFLNSCLGSAAPGADQFSGIAQRLVTSGVPVAIAMQYAIADKEAVLLSTKFYEEIAKGRPIDEALGAARNSLKFHHGDSTGWGAATLHLRNWSGDLRLLPPPTEAGLQPVPSPQTSATPPPSTVGGHLRRLALPLLGGAAALLLALGLYSLLGSDEADRAGIGGDADTGEEDASPETTATTVDGTTSSTTPTDGQIREAASAALTDVGRDEVEVTVAEGTVILSGEVGSDDDREAAEAIVASVAGVVAVINDINVEAASDGGEYPLFHTGNSGLVAAHRLSGHMALALAMDPIATRAGPGDLRPATSAATKPTGASAGAEMAGRPIAVAIDGIGLRSTVEPVGVGEEDHVDPPDPTTIGWYNAGSTPGRAGSTILAGHVDHDGRPAVFFDLQELNLGDRIEIETADGGRMFYVVTANALHEKDRLPAEVFAEDGQDMLYLITCGGDFDRQLHTYRHNRVVTARALTTDHGGTWR